MPENSLSWPKFTRFAPSRANILVVEDNPKVSAALALSIRTRDHRVTIAGSSEEADKWLSAKTFDLLILDINLPRMNGIEFLEWTMARWPVLPVIMLTAHDSLDTALRCLRVGARGYLTKPVDPELLFHTIRDALATQRLLAAWNHSSGTWKGVRNA